ncbi:hypothetical protein F4804DRAFT_319486 [Jackrogersella minutella]|nr:hypothetical protein F4804DRAFT_319486 [Jackrogersella minutella]
MEVFNNITAQEEHHNYMVDWVRGVETDVEHHRAIGNGRGFLELLQSGDIVVLWARAQERAWLNKVGAATIEIECKVL